MIQLETAAEMLGQRTWIVILVNWKTLTVSVVDIDVQVEQRSPLGSVIFITGFSLT